MEDEGAQIGYLALSRGVPVHAADGPRVGTVHRVLDNEREHIFDGIVVDTPDGRRFVDAPEVARIAERRVTLRIDAAHAARCRTTPDCAAGWKARRSAGGSAGGGGSGAEERAQPASTGSRAPSLTSVSASSAAGSESRTTPTPA